MVVRNHIDPSTTTMDIDQGTQTEDETEIVATIALGAVTDLDEVRPKKDIPVHAADMNEMEAGVTEMNIQTNLITTTTDLETMQKENTTDPLNDRSKVNTMTTEVHKLTIQQHLMNRRMVLVDSTESTKMNYFFKMALSVSYSKLLYDSFI